MPFPFYVLVFIFCLMVCCSDLYEHRVPNAWLLAMLLIGLISVVWLSWKGVGPPWPALLGLLIGLAVLLPFYAMGWMGAGDVKFFAVLGFLMGAKALLPIWIIGSLLAGVHAIAIIIFRAGLKRSASLPIWMQAQADNSGLWQRVLIARQGRQGLPYAAYMAVGAILVLMAPTLTQW